MRDEQTKFDRVLSLVWRVGLLSLLLAWTYGACTQVHG
jgi:hypothetical protein